MLVIGIAGTTLAAEERVLDLFHPPEVVGEVDNAGHVRLGELHGVGDGEFGRQGSPSIPSKSKWTLTTENTEGTEEHLKSVGLLRGLRGELRLHFYE